tara:strand:- start:2214 stop:2399 length:186 start_codon:yes stop_codon:yes gene_type:complete
MELGDLVRLRPNFRKGFLPNLPEYGLVTHVNGIGNINILLPDSQTLEGVMLGNVEKVNESR